MGTALCSKQAQQTCRQQLKWHAEKELFSQPGPPPMLATRSGRPFGFGVKAPSPEKSDRISARSSSA